MNDSELVRLERDLSTVSGRLARRLDWDDLGPRVLRALRRPERELAAAIALVAIWAGLGFWEPAAWVLGLGFAIAVLPGAVRRVRDRRLSLERHGAGDLFEVVRRELRTRLAEHLVQSLVAVAFALVFALLAALGEHPAASLGAAALLVGVAGVRMLWFLPRAARELGALERGDARS